VLKVRGYIYDVIPAGGYQLYGMLGTSLSQARPLHVGLYGLPHEQARFTPVINSALFLHGMLASHLGSDLQRILSATYDKWNL